MSVAGAAVNYYEVLGLTKQASRAEIKRAYHQLALQHHPDKNAGSAEATEQFKMLVQAYEVCCSIDLFHVSVLLQQDRNIYLSMASTPSPPTSKARLTNLLGHVGSRCSQTVTTNHATALDSTAAKSPSIPLSILTQVFALSAQPRNLPEASLLETCAKGLHPQYEMEDFL
jgi:hypothetical protein